LRNKYIIHGIAQIGFSAFWLWHFGKLFYLYHFTEFVFFFMYPDWLLSIYTLLSIIGIFIGYFVCLRKIKLKSGYFIILGLLILGFILDSLILQIWIKYMK